MEDQHIKQELSENFSEQYPLQILLAEDDTINQYVGIKILNKLGYKPDMAVNGSRVLEMAKEKKYDLILMDVRMPGIDGLEATKIIRSNLSSQPVIIAMTASAMQGDKEACLNSGMDDYICKPINFQDLITILKKWA